MDDITAVKKIMHFYYCLLVNIRMRRIYYSKIKRQDNSRSLKKWLKNAKEKKLFDPLVSNEIDWLVTEVDSAAAPSISVSTITRKCHENADAIDV